MKQLILSVGPIELWTEGLEDDGPFLRIFSKCSLCDTEIHSRKFDVREGPAISEEEVQRDVECAQSHKCPLPH